VSADQIIGLALALLVMLVGLIGSVVPGLPGTPVLAAAAIGHRLYFGEHGASNLVLILIALLTLLSFGLDYLASTLGARKMGATWRGVVGAIVGTIIGFFFNLPGLILGPFLGAALFEALGGRKWKEAGQAGVGAVLGMLLGAVGKLACCLAIMALFTVSVILRSGATANP
jgi:uncharacterized protein